MTMPELHDLLERRASRYAPQSDLFDRVLDRRRRRDRNRRVGTVVVAMVVAATAIGGLARAFMWGAGTQPADQGANGFVGEWASVDYNHYLGAQVASHQTMTISAGENGVLHIRAQADQTASVCSERRPGQDPRYVFFESTMTGNGRLEDPTTLVVPSPVVTCLDGRDPVGEGLSSLEEAGSSYTLVLDLATDRLYDNLGVVWNRGAPPENWAAPSTEAGVDGPGTFAMLHGEVTFRAAEPWNDHVEAYIDPRLFFLTGPGGERSSAGMSILVNPLPPQTPCDSLRVPPSAEELVEAIRSNPDLEATVPVTERVGSVDALRMDVVAAPGASTGPCGGGPWVPVVSVPGRGGWGGVELGVLGRFYVLDLPGGSARTIAISITAREVALFERAVEAAAPVLDSFEFHTG
jgi:hypothetical protein